MWFSVLTRARVPRRAAAALGCDPAEHRRDRAPRAARSRLEVLGDLGVGARGRGRRRVGRVRAADPDRGADGAPLRGATVALHRRALLHVVVPVAAHARCRRPVDLRRQDVGAVGDLARNLEATTDTTIGDR